MNQNTSTSTPSASTTSASTTSGRPESGRRIVPTGRRRVLALSAGLALGVAGLAAGVGAGQVGAIVDGDDATIRDNPWQVALSSPDGEQFCGGSIVSDRVIVTAAHCVQGTPENEVVVLAGVGDLGSDGGQQRNVTAIVEHPRYAEGVGDIAMLVLDRPLELGGDVGAIELASGADIAAADSARVTGWGATSETSDDTPTTLQSTEVPLVSDAECSLIEVGNADELCAGGTGTDSCYGDSGGPLTVATDEGRKLAGVVSWGEECGGDTAGVYAEVPTFADWVAERIADPDAPAGERLPAPHEFDDGDEFDEFDIDPAFVEQYGDPDLETMSDDEFDDFIDAYVDWLDAEWLDVDDGGSLEVGNDPTEIDEEPATESSGGLPSDDVLDAMSDAEFERFIDGLSDAEFDALVDRWDAADAELGDPTDDQDAGQPTFEADFEIDPNDSDIDALDDEFDDAEFGDIDGNELDDAEFDHEWGDFGDDEWDEFGDHEWDEFGDHEWDEFGDHDFGDDDLNGDDIVQWSELIG